ncbi:MAG: NAD(P)/FAD-dependent oxidoreductase, partial [Clostridia bacterium]|nr:NAD(P)/FAD-dependent oxidoreductase [Clostridia bacterium]
MHDLIIVGSGPAGLTAALYARRAEKSVLILEKAGFGGQMTFSPKIENYPGFPSVSGNELADVMVEQVLAQGAELELEEALSIEAHDGIFTVTTDC